MKYTTYTNITITCTYFTLDVKQVSLVLGSGVFEHGVKDIRHAAGVGSGILSRGCCRYLILVLQMSTAGLRSTGGKSDSSVDASKHSGGKGIRSAEG